MYKINPDSKPVLVAVAAGTGLVFLTSFALSFNALHDVAGWARVPFWLAGAVPVMLDVAMVVYSLSALVRRARGERAWFSWTLLAFFTAISLVGNAAHTVGIPEEYRPYVGMVVVALAPVAALAALENLAGLVVASPGARILPAAEGEAEHSAVVHELRPAEAEELDLLAALASPHPQSKRTPENLATILTLSRRNARVRDIADAVGMSPTLVKTALRDMAGVGLIRVA